MRILAIQRAEQFSPNSVEKDLAILSAVADRLRARGHEVELVSEEQLPYNGAAPRLVLTMSRLPETLQRLKALGVKTINAPEGVENCGRSRLLHIMESIGTPVPPKEGPDGYWLKRGDAAAQSRGDVVFAKDREQLADSIREMRQRGISDFTVSAHVRGDLVKFYGVGSDFFRYYYPTDDGQTKFNDEQRNGAAHHYPFDAGEMQHEVARLAAAVGIAVYGGDCIVREDGSFCVIDFNDWPSFSRCREEAADAIASLVLKD